MSSSVTSVRSPIRSMRMTRRSSGIGARHERVPLEPVLLGQPAHLRGEQRQDRLHREEAEVLALRDPDAARLRHLEPVTHLEPADGAPLDPLDRHAQVVEPHLGHRGDDNVRSVGSAADDRRSPSAAVRPARNTASTRGSSSCLVCMAQFMVILDATIVNVALPSIQATSRCRRPTCSGSSTRTR